jgi:hypothetical protein
MNLRLYIVALSLLVLAWPALAESSPSFGWDLSLAPPTSEAEIADEPCRANPYALYRRGCPDELNIGLERSDSQRVSALDQFLLFVDRHKSLALDTDLRPNTKLKFTVGLVNLYEQEAQARLSLRIRF